MANINEEIGNFSIQDTMEMGGGNRELLDSFLSSDSATASPDNLEKIGDKTQKKKEDKAAPAATTAKKEPGKKEDVKEEPKEDPNETVNSFLSDDEGEESQSSEKETNKEEGEEETKESGKEDNRFNALSKDLFKLGVFTKDDGEEDVEINSPEDFLERFNQEGKKRAIETINGFIGQFGEEYQRAFDSIFVKGVDPKEYFGTYNEIENLASLDMKVEANQLAVIKQTLVEQGYEGEDLTAELERIKNYGDLEAVATRNQKILLKKEASKLAEKEKESEQRLKQQAAVRNMYINNVQTVLQNKLKTKEFDGIPLNPNLAAELQDFLVTEKYKTPSGETLTEFDRTILELKRPENHEKKVKIGLLLKVLEKDPTLATIQRAGVSKKSDTLFGELARQSGKSSNKSEKVNTNKSSLWQGL